MTRGFTALRNPTAKRDRHPSDCGNEQILFFMKKRETLDPTVPPSPGPPVDAGLVRPRHTDQDAFEQNPLNQVSQRLSIQAAEGLDDASRVREALRIVLDEGISVSDAAKRCQIAPSCLAQWREKYLHLLNEEPSIADRPLLERGEMLKDADLIQIPRAAREYFAANWERLIEVTRATPATFRQQPMQLFLENSWLTSWLYDEGRIDRGVAAGAGVVLAVLVLTTTFLAAGHFYRQEESRPEVVENVEASIRRAATVAQQFFAAEGAEQKMQYVRLTDQTRALIEDYYRTHSAASIPDAHLTMAMPGTDLYALEFDIPSLERKHLCVVVDRGGQMLVDWETSSLFQEENFANIRRTKSTSPVRIAARVVPDDYYNFGFSAAKYTCFRLGYYGLKLDLFAYAAKDSLEEQTLLAMLQPVTANERQINAILSVKFPAGENVADNQVEIAGILNENWVAP